MSKCPSGKRGFQTYENAVEALLSARTRFEYREGQGPVAVYQCEDCGSYHLTSKGPVNDELRKRLSDGSIERQRRANSWEDRLKRK